MKIYVDTEEEKQEILNQSKYIHDFLEVVKYRTKTGKPKERWIGLDSDKAGGLMHIYMAPEIIVVKKNHDKLDPPIMTRHELNMLDFEEWYEIKKSLLPISFDEFLKEHYIKGEYDRYIEIQTQYEYSLEALRQFYREVYWDI